MQNTSHAVMAQRTEPKRSLDDFPTPPWATRALLEHAVGTTGLKRLTCLEPACNRGFMAEPLSEYFKSVKASDVFDYGYGAVSDFLDGAYHSGSFDWVITNPPFNLAEKFFVEASRVARHGVALLTRTTFIESVGRYNRLFSQHPPKAFWQFTERVPMVKGRLDKKASTATGYGWLVWDVQQSAAGTTLGWVPPCRKSLELDGDYLIPSPKKSAVTSKRKSSVKRHAPPVQLTLV
ncbi:MAG: SAM-dependent methyltransferase [Alphaproteobacteria bacterium]|nr:SAM-dependent methyltransferase [Alphaproteobacteria bacterium]